MIEELKKAILCRLFSAFLDQMQVITNLYFLSLLALKHLLNLNFKSKQTRQFADDVHTFSHL